MKFRLRPLYMFGGYAAAVCLCLICLMITAQIAGRILDKILVLFGSDSLGLAIPGLSEISGFLLVGASFLGLAYTFVHGGHIRVTLLIGNLPPKIRVFVELFCLSVALLLCSYLGWFTWTLVLDSIAFNEISYGMVPVPLWIPQSGMLLGTLLLGLSLLEVWLWTCIIAFTQPGEFRIVEDSHE